MIGSPWHKRYHSDALTGYQALDLEERGAYTTLLDLLYDRGDAIQITDRLLAGYFNVSVRKATALLAQLIAKGKIVRLEDGRLTNPRFEKERENALKTSRELAENGSKGGRKRAEKQKFSSEIKAAAEAPLEVGSSLPEARSQKLDVSCVSSDTQLGDAALEACLRRAAGWESHPNPMLAVTGPITALMEAGANLELDVLPVIRAIAPKCRKPTWKYFLDAIADARDQRLSAASATVIPITSQTARIYHAAHRSKPSRDDSFAAIDAAIDELERRQRP